MKCFELVRAVLDDVYSDLGPSGADDVKKSFSIMSRHFGSLRSMGGPEYSDPATRCGYVFKYVTCHANLVYQTVARCSDLRAAITRNDRVWVTCLGGGPGSDLLGLVKYLETLDNPPIPMFYICDRERFWRDTWGDVGMRLDSVSIHSSYEEHDALDSKTWATKKFLNSDLFTLIYFMSELEKHRSEAHSYLENVLGADLFCDAESMT